MNPRVLLALMAGIAASEGLAPIQFDAKPKAKDPKPRREYTPEQLATIEELEKDRSSPGRKKLKLYRKSLRQP